MLKRKILVGLLVILGFALSFLAGQQWEKHWGRARAIHSLHAGIDRLSESLQRLPIPTPTPSASNFTTGKTTVGKSSKENGKATVTFSH